jgi:hypothetical protein
LSELLKLKWQVDKNLNEHLEIMEKILILNEKDAIEFIGWYNNNRTRKGIEEIYGILESGRNGHTKTQESSTVFLGCCDKEEIR